MGYKQPSSIQVPTTPSSHPIMG